MTQTINSKNGVLLASFLMFMVFGSAFGQQSRTFKITKNLQTGESRETEVQQRCWKYTWLGPENPKANLTVSCSAADLRRVPCAEPFVWTKGSCNTGDYCKDNQPNLTKLIEACDARQPVCNPFCVPLSDEVCIKATYFLPEGTFVNATSFCGKGILSTSNGEAIKTGCHIQENVEGYNFEACFCDPKTGDQCNNTTKINASWTLAISVLIMLSTQIFR